MVERYRRRKGKAALLGSHQKCWLWGRHVVTETLRAARWPILELYVDQDRIHDDLTESSRAARDRDIPLHTVPHERLTQLCHSREHQGILAKMAPFPYDELSGVFQKAKRPPLFAVLAGLQDPHNFGAVIRSAHVLGVDALFVPTREQVDVTALVARSSAGAVNHVRIAQTDDLVSLAGKLQSQGIRLVGASHTATRAIFDYDFTRPTAILIGNEGTGIRPELADACDELVMIPQFGAVESLNAAVAAGIFFYEAQRQRATAGAGSSRRK